MQTSEAHGRLAREAATNAVTLLKNDGVLPLQSPAAGGPLRKIAILGAPANAGKSSPYYSGGGSGNVPPDHVVSPLEGISKLAGAKGFEIIESPTGNVAKGLEAAAKSDVVIVVGAASATEGSDRWSLNLDDEADALISAVADVRPTVVLMMTPGAVLTPWRDRTAAVLNLFVGGQETGSAFAAVLFGDAEPRGKLPILFPATSKDVIEPKPQRVVYEEGLFTSYRSPNLKAAFPFGHGLSYTSFELGPVQVLSRSAASVSQPQRLVSAVGIALNVTNTGRRAGSEVVQAYLRFGALPERPRKVLRSFAKSRLLQPGERQELLLDFTARDLSSYSTELGWVLQRDIRVQIGTSSEDIRQEALLWGSPSDHGRLMMYRRADPFGGAD